jgi:DNA-binding transcriptional LysR family regulator
LQRIPSVRIRIDALLSSEGTTEVLSGRDHACILPREPSADLKLDARPLSRDRLVLGCGAEHPLAGAYVVRAEDLEFSYIDRLSCEFRDQFQEHFALARSS